MEKLKRLLMMYAATCLFLGLYHIYLNYPQEVRKNTMLHIFKEFRKKQTHFELNSLRVFYVKNNDTLQYLFNTPCSTRISKSHETDLNISNIYEKFNLGATPEKYSALGKNFKFTLSSEHHPKKLKVIVLPHSHNDPGWLWTFEDYYKLKTKYILENMVLHLSQNPKLKFVWSEISFLSLFWKDSDDETKSQIKKLIANEQLEIVTGGWVMNDEACTHYFSILEQMIEGHQWVANNLNYAPKNSWSVDPFGHSPVMPYLLKRMGIENIVIQRVHYAVKDFLANSQNLEFFWRQMWKEEQKMDVFTHMMPFNYAYFHKNNILGDTIRNSSLPPLLVFFKKMSQLFRTNILLVPLGDDFSYNDFIGNDGYFWSLQRKFDFLNKYYPNDIEVSFGTLNDYFKNIHELYSSEKFGVFSGDFFTYADTFSDYWSGYFTSRPFYKRKDRILMNYLRTTEIMYGLTLGTKNNMGRKWYHSHESCLYEILTAARRNFCLFQHHDAITGTSKKLVMLDYAQKLNDAINGLKYIMQQCAYFLLNNNEKMYMPRTGPIYFDVDELHEYALRLPKCLTIIPGKVTNPRRVVIFNSLTWKRKSVVTLCVVTPYVEVSRSDKSPLKSQTSPVFSETGAMMRSLYYLSFIVELNPLSLQTFFIYRVSPRKNVFNTHSKITLFNFDGDLIVSEGFENVDELRNMKKFSLSNHFLNLHFNSLGFLSGIDLKLNNSFVRVNLDIVEFLDTAGGGPYIFKPSQFLRTMKKSVVCVTHGSIYSQVDVDVHLVHHSVRLYKTSGVHSLGLEIKNIVKTNKKGTSEIGLRISSDIKNGNEFFTDLNGLQMMRRKYVSKLPIAGNFYPMSSAAFIEDENHRLTILSGQPSGFALLQEGQMAIMLHRSGESDDSRGVAEGLHDDVPTCAVFTLILEKKDSACQQGNDTIRTLSRYGYLLSYFLLYPLIKFFPKSNEEDNLNFQFSTMMVDGDHDIHLVKLHCFVNEEEAKVGVIFHRVPIDYCVPVLGRQFLMHEGSLNLSEYFPDHFGDMVIPASLSFLYASESVPKTHVQHLCPMEMKAYVFPNQYANVTLNL